MPAMGDVGPRTSRLGRYELITRIGEGGMAEVQLALQRGPAGFEKLVVVKLVHETLAAQKDFVDMLLDEARVAALLKHPNVIDIYDLGEADGRFFIAMEYLEGEPLLAVLRAGREGKRLDTLSTARLVADTAEGLDAAHELRSMSGDPLELVHHDVSLGNIVVLYNGQVKLVDFGVAKATQSVAPARRVQGKFSYMAPEKLRGDAGDRRSDIWSLGCVLWESLTLKRLFKGGNDSDTRRQVLESEIPTPSSINSDVSPAFDPLVMRALKRDPELRYPTAKELSTDLEELLRKEGYGGKNDKIAKYMQATFASHIAARKQLLQEVSSKGRASADVLEAAFDDGMLGSGSPVHMSDFSGRFKSSTIEGMPTHVRRRPGSTGQPSRAPTFGDPLSQSQVSVTPPTFAQAANRMEYPRANPSDLPPIVARDDDSAATQIAPSRSELSSPGAVAEEPSVSRPGRPATSARGLPLARRRVYLAIGAVAFAAALAALFIARRGGGGEGPAALAAPGSDAVVAAADPAAGEAGAASPEGAGSAEPGTAGEPAGGPDDAPGEEIQLPPDRVSPDRTPRPRPVGKPVEKVDPAVLYRSGINAYVLGDMKTAMAQLKRALAASPSYAIAWRGVGLVHEKRGETRAAAQAFQRYLQLAPNASDASAIRAKIGGGK